MSTGRQPEQLNVEDFERLWKVGCETCRNLCARLIADSRWVWNRSPSDSGFWLQEHSPFLHFVSFFCWHRVWWRSGYVLCFSWTRKVVNWFVDQYFESWRFEDFLLNHRMLNHRKWSAWDIGWQPPDHPVSRPTSSTLALLPANAYLYLYGYRSHPQNRVPYAWYPRLYLPVLTGIWQLFDKSWGFEVSVLVPLNRYHRAGVEKRACWQDTSYDGRWPIDALPSALAARCHSMGCGCP